MKTYTIELTKQELTYLQYLLNTEQIELLVETRGKMIEQVQFLRGIRHKLGEAYRASKGLLQREAA